MSRAIIFIAGICVLAACPVNADYSVENRGAWPESWPKELEPLRQHSRTFEGPRMPLLHYAIHFTKREEFEAAWPELLKIKTKGAPIILRRGPNFWLGGASHGVCVHTPPAGTKPIEAPNVKNARWENTNYIELIVDGRIVDLNRIFLPPDTLLIDERFKSEVTMPIMESAAPTHAAQIAKDERIEPLLNRKSAFRNRPYWWVLPKQIPFTKFIRIAVGGKGEQKIQIDKTGWIHIALARNEEGEDVDTFVKKNRWEKTDFTIGYRVPLMERATRMRIYRKKAPVGEMIIPRVNWSGPVILVP